MAFKFPFRERMLMAEAFTAAMGFSPAQEKRIADGADWPKATPGSRHYALKRAACDASWQALAAHRQTHGLPRPESSTYVTRAAPMYARRMLQSGSVADQPTLKKGWKVDAFQGNMLQRLADAIPKGYKDDKGQDCGFSSVAHACKKSELVNDLVTGMGFKTAAAAERLLRREHSEVYYAVQDDRRERNVTLSVVRTVHNGRKRRPCTLQVHAKRVPLLDRAIRVQAAVVAILITACDAPLMSVLSCSAMAKS